MRSRFLSTLFLLLSVSGASAQSNPGLVTGQVPTAAQWNSYFSAKKDFFPYTALNKAGDSMGGLLRLSPATSASSGLSIQQGSAPSSPINGDTWMTTAGLFYRANGVTYGPITGTVNCAGMPAFSGAISSTAGTCTTAFSATVPIANGGTGQTSSSAALAALGGAPLASPTFTGVPLSTTPGSSDNSTKVATTAFVKAQGYLTACPDATDMAKGCMFAPTNPPASHNFLTGYNGTAWVSDQPSCADISDAVSTCNSLVSPAFTGTPTAPTQLTSDNSTKIATTAFIKAQGYVTSASFPVTTVFGRTGDIVSQNGDYAFSQISGTATVSQGGTGSGTAGGARTNLAVPGLATANVFTANITLQNNLLCFQLDCGAGSGTTGILQFDGTSQFQARYITGGVSHLAIISADSATLNNPLSISNGGTGQSSASAALAALAGAPLASPTFTGTPAAPTPTSSDNTTKLATTAFVKAQAYAPIASPTFTGTASAPTPSTSDNTTKIATTAFVNAQAYAPLASPSFTGTPLAPTATSGTNTTQIATTAFVQDAIGGVGGAVSSVFGRTGAVVAASNDYNFNQLAGTATVAQGGTGSGTASGARSNLAVPGLATSNTYSLSQIFGNNLVCFGFDCGTPGAGNTAGIIQFDGFDTFTLEYKAGALHTAKLSMDALTLATDLTVANGGTGVGTFASNGILYGNGTSPLQALAVNSTATNKYLRQVSSGAPSWQQVPFSDLSGTLASGQFGPLTGDVTTSGYATTLAKIQGTSITGTTGNGNVALSDNPIFTTAVGISGSLSVNSQIAAGSVSSGGAVTSSYTAGSQFAINPLSVVDRQYAFKTNGNLRWAWGVDNATESGTNAGSNAYLGRYTDAGALIDKPLTIIRSTGVANFVDGLQSAGNNVLTTASSISLTSQVSGILPGANGGTGNGFFAASGPTTSLKTFTFPNASATILTDNAAVTIAQGGTGSGSASSARSALAVPGLSTANVFTSNQTLQNNLLCFQLDCGSISGTVGVVQFDGTGAFAFRKIVSNVNGLADLSVGSLTLGTQLSIANGGTGAFTQPGALASLGALGSANNLSDVPSAVTSTNNLGHWYKTLSATVSKTANNIFGGITDLSINGVAGKTYSFDIVLSVTADATNGMKFRMGGTSTATSTGYTVKILCLSTRVFDATAYSTTWSSSSTSDITCTSTLVEIKGTVVINAAGNLAPQWAQQATTNPSGITSVLMDGSYAEYHQIN